MNPNKWFKNLSIKAKLIIAFVFFTLLPVTFLGSYGIYMHMRDLENIAIDCLNQDVITTRGKLQKFLVETGEDIRFLSGARTFTELLNDLKLKTTAQANNNLVKNAGYDFKNFVDRRKIYYGISFIYPDEKNGFAITYHKSDDQVQFETNLTAIANNPFLKMAANLGDLEIAFAPIEFMDNNHTIQTINYTRAFYNADGTAIGILATSIFADEFLNVLNEYNTDGQAVLISQKGKYLYDSRKEMDWGQFISAEKFKPANIQSLYDNYPENMVLEIVSGKPGVIAKGTDHILSFAPIALNPDQEGYIYCRSVPKEKMFASVYHFRNLFFMSTAVSLVTAVFLGFIAARTFTKPIKQLIQGSEIIANGNYDYNIQVETNDELETLAEKFKFMATSLKERGKELEKHQNHLERTRHLMTAWLFQGK